MPRGVLKSSLLLVGTLGMAETPEDAARIPAAMTYRATPQSEGMVPIVTQWTEAWQAGDLDGMARCLHPGLSGRILALDTAHRREDLQRQLGIQTLFGKATQDHYPAPEVRVLDVQGRSGSARVDLGPWTAFMHLAAYQGGWAIVNVLWEWRR